MSEWERWGTIELLYQNQNPLDKLNSDPIELYAWRPMKMTCHFSWVDLCAGAGVFACFRFVQPTSDFRSIDFCSLTNAVTIKFIIFKSGWHHKMKRKPRPHHITSPEPNSDWQNWRLWQAATHSNAFQSKMKMPSQSIRRNAPVVLTMQKIETLFPGFFGDFTWQFVDFQRLFPHHSSYSFTELTLFLWLPNQIGWMLLL